MTTQSEAEAKRAETLKRAGVGSRDFGHMPDVACAPGRDIGGDAYIEQLWACISAIAKRIEKLEGK